MLGILGIASMGLNLVGGGINAKASYDAAKYNAAALDFNATMKQIQAADTMSIARENITDLNAATEDLKSEQIASYAAQGVDVSTGVSLDLAEATDAKRNQDARRIYNNAVKQAWGLQMEAMQARQEAAFTKKQGRYAAFGSLLGVGSSTGMSAYNMFPRGSSAMSAPSASYSGPTVEL